MQHYLSKGRQRLHLNIFLKSNTTKRTRLNNGEAENTPPSCHCANRYLPSQLRLASYVLSFKITAFVARARLSRKARRLSLLDSRRRRARGIDVKSLRKVAARPHQAINVIRLSENRSNHVPGSGPLIIYDFPS